MPICKVCEEEGSYYSLINPIIENLDIHENCIEKAVEEGRMDLVEELFWI